MSLVLLRFILRRHWLSTLLCCLVPLAIGLIVGFLYPTYSGERQLAKIFKLSERFFGGAQIDMFSAAGSFTLPVQHPLVLVSCAVAAAIVPTALPAGERGRGALDVLLATPLERHRLVLTVAAFGVGFAVLWGTMGFVSAWVGATLSGVTAEIPWGRYAVVAANSSALFCAFAATSQLVSVIARDRTETALVYGIVVFCAMAVDVTARLWRAGAWLARLTPYGYLRPAPAIATDGAATTAARDAAILLAFAVVLVAAAVVLQVRRKSA